MSENFFRYSIKPINLQLTATEQEQVPYASDLLEVNTHAVHLKESHIPFLLSIVRKKVPFSVLANYLVFNQITGMLHLYMFG